MLFIIENYKFYDLDIKRLNQDIETKEKRITELSEKIKLKKEEYDKLNNYKKDPFSIISIEKVVFFICRRN